MLKILNRFDLVLGQQSRSIPNHSEWIELIIMNKYDKQIKVTRMQCRQAQ